MQHTNLLKHLFEKPSLEEISEAQLSDMAGAYPYFAQARWLLALKKQQTEREPQPEALLAGAYAFHPLRLQQYFLEAQPVADKGPRPGAAPIAAPPETPPGHTAPAGDEPQAAPLIQPLFTEDYFAYTGTRLPEHIENDKRPTMEQLHSFTDWLRTLRRPQGTTDPDLREDEASRVAHAENEDAAIRKSAESSVRSGEEVLTEAMAEVRAGKGQADKAIAIYEKLSLSNPEKSAYFAQKIEVLKNK